MSDIKITMNAEEVLSNIRAKEELPENWVVFPLLRPKIITAILGWIGGIIMGSGLLALIIPIVIPENYTHGIAPAIVTTLILCTFAFIFIGSLILLVSDIRRLNEIEKHVIVITDEDFIKQEGNKIIQVPLSHVRHVTARGRAPGEDNPPAHTKDHNTSPMQLPGMRDNMLGMFIGRGGTGSTKKRRTRMRTPTSLAFIDVRIDKEITVVNDSAYGDPFLIAAVLKEHVTAANQ